MRSPGDALLLTVNAGMLLYLGQTRGYDYRELEDLLYRKSGLLGVSGISADVRVLLTHQDPAAHLAIELFCDRAAREIAGLVCSLDGIDRSPHREQGKEHGSPFTLTPLLA